MQMEGNSTIVEIWWKISTGAIRPSPEKLEKPESDRFDETSIDFLFGTSASATWALPVRRGGIVLRIPSWRVLAQLGDATLAHTGLSFVQSGPASSSSSSLDLLS
jgi:hypothetical protein